MKRNSERGFTLLELMVTAVIVVLIAGIVQTSLSGIMRTRKKLEDERVITRTAQYVMQRMTRELQNRLEESIDTQRVSAVANGIDAPPGVVLLGRDAQSPTGDADLIAFVSNGTGQALFNGPQNSGVVDIVYRLFQGQDGKSVLLRDEWPNTSQGAVPNSGGTTAGNTPSAAQAVNERMVSFPISDRVSRLNFRYRQGQRWLDQWARDELPDAVEITIRVEADGGTAETFRTAVALKQ